MSELIKELEKIDEKLKKREEELKAQIQKEKDTNNKKKLEREIREERNNAGKDKINSILAFINENGLSKLDAEDFAPPDAAADVFAKFLGEKMKVSQLRKVFDEFKRLEKEVKGKNDDNNFDRLDELFLLLPEIAYAKARDLIKEEFYELLKVVIGSNKDNTKIKTVRDFKKFVAFLTAILAYHKQYSKKGGE